MGNDFFEFYFALNDYEYHFYDTMTWFEMVAGIPRPRVNAKKFEKDHN